MTNESINQELNLDELDQINGGALWYAIPAGYGLYKLLEYAVDKLMEKDSNVISSNADKANKIDNDSEGDTGDDGN